MLLYITSFTPKINSIFQNPFAPRIYVITYKQKEQLNINGRPHNIKEQKGIMKPTRLFISDAHRKFHRIVHDHFTASYASCMIFLATRKTTSSREWQVSISSVSRLPNTRRYREKITCSTYLYFHRAVLITTNYNVLVSCYNYL